MTIKEFLTEVAEDCAVNADVVVIPLDHNLQARVEFVEYMDAPGGVTCLILFIKPNIPSQEVTR